MNTKLKLIKLLMDQPNGLHLRGISRELDTGMPNVKRYVDYLSKASVVSSVKEANLVKVKLKPGIITMSYLKRVHSEIFMELPAKVHRSMADLFLELRIKPLICLMFGSYAKGSHSKSSDLDVLLVFQKVEGEKEMEHLVKKISMRNGIKLNLVYVNYDAFESNFLNKDHDFSREIRQDVVIYFGVPLYYSLLWRFYS